MVVPVLKWPADQMGHNARPTEPAKTNQSAVARRPRAANPYVVLPIVGLLLFGAGLALVGQRVHWMTLTYELEAAQKQLLAAQHAHTRLQAAVAAAASLEKMEAAARTRLGMVEPSARAAVVVAPMEQPQTMLATNGSSWANVGVWLQERLTAKAEAGERSGR